MVFQIALIVFGLVAILKTADQYRQRQTSKYWAILFSCLWILVIAVAISPSTTDIVAHLIGVGRGADLVMYIAIIFLVYMVYRLILRQQKLSEELTEMVRQLAVKEGKK